MNLTYPGDWYDATGTSGRGECVLDIGDYTAYAYQPRVNSTEWTWWVRHRHLAAEDDAPFQEIARGVADGESAARAAAEAAITQHHTKRFA